MSSNHWVTYQNHRHVCWLIDDITYMKPSAHTVGPPAGESQFQALVETALDLVAVLNYDGTIRYLSPSVQRVIGYAPEELLGKNAFAYMHQDDTAEQLDAFKVVVSDSDLATSGQAHSFRFRHRDGHWVVLESVSTKLPEGPEPPGIVVNARDITERVQAHESMLETVAMERRLAQESEVIAEVGRIISSTLNIEEVFELFAAQVRRLIRFDMVLASVVDHSQQTATIRYWSGPQEYRDNFATTVPFDGSLTGEVLASGTPVIIHGESEEEISQRFIYLIKSHQKGVLSWLGIPLVNRGQVIGALLLASSEPRAFSDLDIALAERVSNQMAGAIDNAGLFAELKEAEADLAISVIERSESASQNEVIAQIGRIIGSTLNIEEVYQPLAGQVRVLIDFDGLAICVVERKGELGRIAHRSGDAVTVLAVGTPVPFVGSLTGEVAKVGHTIVVHANSEQELLKRYPHIADGYREGIRSWICTPLINRSDFVGSILIVSTKENAFTDRDVKLAQRVGNQIAGAIDSALLYANLRKAEADLNASNDRTQMILETAHDAFVGIDDSGQVVAWNSQAEKTFGWLASQAMGRTLTELIIPDRLASQHMNGIKRFLTTGDGEVVNRRIEMVAKHRYGHEFPVELTISSLKSGDRYLFNAFVRDITERKRLEQEVAQHTESLETANQELQQLDRMKDEFISTVSHELRTPLTSIKGSAELLLTYGDDDRETQLEFLQIIRRESDRLTRLINDVLDLSRMESRQMRWNWGVLDLAEVVNAAMDGTQALMIQKNQSVIVDLDPSLPSLWNDRDRLVQVVNNLLSNSIKFTPQGGQVWINAKVLAADGADGLGEKLEVCVSDSGVGIKPADCESIFEKFKQVGETLSDKPRGTGLGLTICKEIVEYLGGKIWVESTPGKGSSFYFTVPVSAKGQDLEPGRLAI